MKFKRYIMDSEYQILSSAEILATNLTKSFEFLQKNSSDDGLHFVFDKEQKIKFKRDGERSDNVDSENDL